MSSVTQVNGAPEDVTVILSQKDLLLIRSALEEFLASFSHEEGAVVFQIKSLLERLPNGGPKHPGHSSFQRLTL